jgi:radical SAM protein with 4Fe4S-binding SPASM domain
VLSVSRLLNGQVEPGDALRYGRATGRSPAHLLHFSADKKPVVVWNTTQRCNLHCLHCYSSSRDREYADELGYDEARRMLADLARFGVPQSFAEIWHDGNHALERYRLRPRPLPDRCRRCAYLPLCNGGLRARAESATADPRGADPACYLSDTEIEAPAMPPAGERAPAPAAWSAGPSV